MTHRVGVNLAWLVPGVVGGSEEATVGALLAVEDVAATRGIEVVLFGTEQLVLTHPALGERFEFHRLRLRSGKGARVAAETVVLPRLAGRVGVDLMHHAGGVVPLAAPGPVALAIHDTQPLDLPENFSAVKRRYMRLMVPRSVRRATVVTAPSQFVRSRLVDDLGTPSDKVAVVPWSVPAPRPIDPEAALRVDALVGSTPFVLYPAIAYRHKNHAVLLDAVGRLRRDRVDVQLVLTGAAGPCDAEVALRSAAPDLAGGVRVLGRIPRQDLDALIAAASVVAVPSRYEGFGLPALEALAAGRPTIVSSAGSLPEVVGDGALVVDPDDISGWADALASLLDDDDRAGRLVEAGRHVAASWTPRRTASALVDAWTSGLERSSSHISRERVRPERTQESL